MLNERKKEILLSNFKSKLGFCFNHEDLKEVENIIDVLLEEYEGRIKLKEYIENTDKFRKIIAKQAIPLSKITFEQIDNMPQYWDLFTENKKLKEDIKFHEKYNREASDMIISNEFEIKNLTAYIKETRNFLNGNSYGKLSRKMNELDIKYNIRKGDK